MALVEFAPTNLSVSLVIYTVTPQYSSSAFLQYFAIFNVRSFSFAPFPPAPGSPPPWPGSNTTTRSCVTARAANAACSLLVETVATLSLASLSTSSTVPFSSRFPSESTVTNVTSFSLFPVLCAPSAISSTTASGSVSHSRLTPNRLSIPAS